MNLKRSTRYSFIYVPNYIEDVEKLFEYAGNGDAEKFKEIVKKNKKYLFARDSQGRTPLHLAAQNGHAAIVKQVISENAEYTQITDPVSAVAFLIIKYHLLTD